MKNSISVIMPAYNEEKNIESAVRDAKKAFNRVKDWELIVVDDGSTDKTGYILSKLAKKYPGIRILRHKTNMGFGKTIKDGIYASKKEFITQFHGDNDAAGTYIQNMLKRLGEADVIVSYTANSRTRSIFRRFVSKFFVVIMNILFGMNLQYFNGCFLCKRKLLQSITLTSTGFAIYAEAKIRLIKAGATYLEVPFEHTGRKHGKSKAVSMQSAVATINTVASLLYDVYINRKVRTVKNASVKNHYLPTRSTVGRQLK